MKSKKANHISDSLRRRYSQIVLSALVSKYKHISEKTIQDAINQCWSDIESINLDTENKIVKLLVELSDFRSDVNNQLVCLILIELFWSETADIKTPISKLNGMAFGSHGGGAYRTTDSVQDYNQVINVPYEEVPPRMKELEAFAVSGIHLFSEASLASMAGFLAYMHGSIIRIHPFVDGNGRTARFFVQYALRCWNLPPTLIPKVRNAPNWKHALSEAVKGNCILLRDDLELRIQNAMSNYESNRK